VPPTQYQFKSALEGLEPHHLTQAEEEVLKGLQLILETHLQQPQQVVAAVDQNLRQGQTLLVVDLVEEEVVLEILHQDYLMVLE
jgi:hypothetical protein